MENTAIVAAAERFIAAREASTAADAATKRARAELLEMMERDGADVVNTATHTVRYKPAYESERIKRDGSKLLREEYPEVWDALRETVVTAATVTVSARK